MSRSRLWIRVASDVHLEFRENLTTEQKWAALVPRNFATEPDYWPDLDRSCLVLAGDVGYPSSSKYGEFLARCKASFDHVVVVAGNHESYRQRVRVDPERCKNDPTYLPDPRERTSHKGRVRLRWTDAWARDACASAGATFLQKQVHSVDLPDGTEVRFAGCTLWSRIPGETSLEASYSLNDFDHALDDDGGPFTVEAYNRRHLDHSDWLKSVLASENPPDVAVVHHLPSSRLIHDKYAASRLNCCFASDTIPDDLLRKAKLWCAGHSHSFVKKEFGPTTRAIVNPMGYPREHTGYDPTWFFRLEGQQ